MLLSYSFLTSHLKNGFFRVSHSCICTLSTYCGPSPYFFHLLQTSINHSHLKVIQQLHAQIYSCGYEQDPFWASKFIVAYSKCGVSSYSRFVFNLIHQKNIFLWNSMISGYIQNENFEQSFELFKLMCVDEETKPDHFTYTNILKICRQTKKILFGKCIHCQVLKNGFHLDIVLMNSLMLMYASSSMDYALNVFDEMPKRKASSWNFLISEYSTCKEEIAWELVKRMQVDGIKPDAITVTILLPLCIHPLGDHGRQIHCFIIRNGLSMDADSYIGSGLIDMYSKRKNMSLSRYIFDNLSCRSVVTWTAMIVGYIQNGNLYEAFALFHEMQAVYGIVPNRISIVSILPACGSIANLMAGKQVHGFSIRMEWHTEVSVSNALIHMYAKCGNVDYAKHVFDNPSLLRDIISWSSMISAYGLHGKAKEAVLLFHEMYHAGIKPDDVTFVSVLSACGKAGLVIDGFEIYNLLTKRHGSIPTVEVCSCMVDMLCRAGQLDRALDFINSMPTKPTASIWGSLLSASIANRSLEIRDLAYKFLIHLEPHNPSNYISISNIYASYGRWDFVSNVRVQMKLKGLKKFPGCSWISAYGKVHTFTASDKSHPSSYLIYEVVNNLMLVMRETEYSSTIELL